MASKAPPPSTGTPAGVPPSGNTKYVIVAILLLLLVGGVVIWKVTQAPPEVVTVVDAGPPPPPSTGRNPDDDIPLPPPIEDASAEGGKKIVWVTQNNQCDAKSCAGASSPELEQMLAYRVKQAHRCYDQALAQDSTLRGKMSVAVRVGASGGVCSASVASNEMGSSSVANCVLNYFRGANFPPPKGGCADIKIPINFVPRQ